MPNLKHVLPDLRMPAFVPHIYSAQVLVYNPDTVKRAAADDERSARSEVEGQDRHGRHRRAVGDEAASLHETGTTTDFDKAKAFMLKLNANGLRLYPETDALAPAFKSGEIEVGMIWLARTFMWQNAGFPVKGNFPKEGAILYVSGMVVPKNAPDKDAAYKYMNAMLEPSAQQGFAAHMGYLPTVDNAPLSGSGRRATGVPGSEAEAGDAGLSGVRQGDAGPERLVAEEHPARLSGPLGRTALPRGEAGQSISLCSAPPAC